MDTNLVIGILLGCIVTGVTFAFYNARKNDPRGEKPKPYIKLSYKSPDGTHLPLYYNLSYEGVMPLKGSILQYESTVKGLTGGCLVNLMVNRVTKDLDRRDDLEIWIIEVYSENSQYNLLKYNGWHYEMPGPTVSKV